MLKTKNKSVLIIGTGSLLNYGCEAIVQGSYQILKTIMPDCNITVASKDIEYDRTVLPSDVNLVKYENRYSLYRIFKGILRRFFHIGNGSPIRMNTKIGKKYDIVLSCGGDNYCETPDGGIYILLEDLMRVGAYAAKNSCYYVLWGASVGPFRNKDIFNRVRENLALCKLITVREELAYNYVSQKMQLSLTTKLVADPAFCMKPDRTVNFRKDNDFIYVGLNLSSLAVNHALDEEDSEKFLLNLFQSLDSVLTHNNKVRFICIPHVVCEEAVQNDIVFMNQYLEHSIYQDRIEILPARLGARKTKAILEKMDLVVAARMHCCVGAISVSTPTLFVVYSNKGRGMSYYAYGHHAYEVEIKELIGETFLLKLNKMLDNRTIIREYLKNQQKRFCKDALSAGQYLSEIM